MGKANLYRTLNGLVIGSLILVIGMFFFLKIPFHDPILDTVGTSYFSGYSELREKLIFIFSLAYIPFSYIAGQYLASCDLKQYVKVDTPIIVIFIISSILSLFMVNVYIQGNDQLKMYLAIMICTISFGILCILLNWVKLKKLSVDILLMPIYPLVLLGVPLLTLPLASYFSVMDKNEQYIPMIRHVTIICILLLSFIGVFVSKLPRSSLGNIINPKSFIWYVGIPMFLILSSITLSGYRAVDPFHDGQIASEAFAMYQGKTIFRDIVALRSMDTLICFVGFKIFGPSLASWDLMKTLLTIVSVLLSYWMFLKLYGKYIMIFYIIGAFLFPQYFIINIRYLMIPILIVCLYKYLNTNKRTYLILSGLLTALILIVGLDSGISVILAVICTLLLKGYKEKNRWKSVLLEFLYYTGTLIVSLLTILGGKLTDFLEFSSSQLRYLTYFYGAPYPGFRSSIIDVKIFGFLAIPVVALAITYFLKNRLSKPKLTSFDYMFLFSLVYYVIFFNVALGRSDASHILTTAQPFIMIVLFLIYYSSRSISTEKWMMGNRSVGSILLLSIMFIIAIMIQGKDLLNISEKQYQQNTLNSNPKLGFRTNTRTLEKVSNYIVDNTGPSDYIWDFTGGFYYFLTGRNNPTRYYLSYCIYSTTEQKEVIRDLKQKQPKLILFRSGNWSDNIDGIDNLLRHYLISDFLYRSYLPLTEINGNIILGDKRETKRNEELIRSITKRLDFGYIPLYWGENRIFTDKKIPISLNGGKLNNAELVGTRLIPSSKDPSIVFNSLPLNTNQANYLLVEMSVQRGNKAQVFWTNELSEKYKQDQSISFRVNPDGKFHKYYINLSASPGWSWGKAVRSLRFDPSDSDGEIQIKQLQLVTENV